MNTAANRQALGESRGEADVRQNLVDAECPEEAIAYFLTLRSGGNIPEQLAAFLAMHGKTLLARVRRAQYALDFLDYLAFVINKKSKNNES